MISHVILGLLRDGHQHHGYELIVEYRARSGGAASAGNFYRELARLAERGLVETGHNPPDADARRIPYRITDKGRRTFDRWLVMPPLQEGELGGWLLFLDQVPAAARDAILDRWQDLLWARSKDLARQHCDALDAGESWSPAADYRPLGVLLARQIKHAAADLEFLTELRANFQAWLDRRRGGAAEKTDDLPIPEPGRLEQRG